MCELAVATPTIGYAYLSFLSSELRIMDRVMITPDENTQAIKSQSLVSSEELDSPTSPRVNKPKPTTGNK